MNRNSVLLKYESTFSPLMKWRNSSHKIHHINSGKTPQNILKYTLSFLLVFSFFLVDAKQIPDPPNPPRLVNDFANILKPTEVNALERKLVAYDDSTSSQIAIVIENSLEGDDLFEYSYRIAREWDIGRKGKWNGLLIYVAAQDRKVGIHVGQGLQGTVPDALAKRIINNVIRPAFREGQYYAGLNRATSAIMDLASGEFENDETESEGIPILPILIIIFAIILIIYSNRNDGGGYYRGGRYDYDQTKGKKRRRGGGGWIIVGDPFGGWGRSGGGGGGFGGLGGGGGFGGFGGGGGGFDGGGAFGDW